MTVFSVYMYNELNFRHGYNINEINHDNRYKHRNYRTDEPPTLIIDDNNPMLVNVCKTLENVFRHGAIQEDKRNKFELIDFLLHITRKQSTGYYSQIAQLVPCNGFFNLTSILICYITKKL